MDKLRLNLMKLKMFITSYCPLYVMLIILNAKDYRIIYNIYEMKNRIDIKMTIFIGVLLLLIIISISSTLDILTTKWENKYIFNTFDKTGDSVISYMMTYIVPLLSDDFLTFQSITVNITLYVLIGIMYIRLNLIYFNPVWLVFGYSTYISDNGTIIISNLRYEVLNQNAANQFQASYIIDKIYLIRKKDNLQML